LAPVRQSLVLPPTDTTAGNGAHIEMNQKNTRRSWATPPQNPGVNGATGPSKEVRVRVPGMSEGLRRTSAPLITQQTYFIYHGPSISYIAGPALPTINPGVCVGVMGVCVGVRGACVSVRGACVGVRVVMQIFADLSGCPREVPGCIDPPLAQERPWAKTCTPQRPPLVHFHHRILSAVQ